MPVNLGKISTLNPTSRLPKASHIAGVYAIIVLMIYAWTILWFFWKLPSWMHFLQADEILAVLSISIVTNFLESLIVLFCVVLLALILPKSWFAEAFIVRGTSLVLLSLGYLMFLAFQFQEEAYPKILVLLLPILFIVFFILTYFLARVSLIARVIEAFATKAVIFLYIYIPLSILSVVVWLFLFFPRPI